jgi:hypothetical protein
VFVGIAALPALAMRLVHMADNTWLHVHSLVQPEWKPGEYMWNFVVALGFFHISSVFGLLTQPALVKLASSSTLSEECSPMYSLWFAAAGWRGYLWIAVLKITGQLIIPELIALGLLIAQIGIADAAGINDFTGLPSLVFLIVPIIAGFGLFLWIGACFSLAIPAATVEHLKGTRALRRSWHLSRRGRGRIMLTWLAIAITSGFLLWAVQLLFHQSFIFLSSTIRSPLLTRALYLQVSHILNTAFSALLGPIYPIALTLFYYDQRIRHEGYDIERLMDAAGMTAPLPPPAGDNPIVPVLEDLQP